MHNFQELQGLEGPPLLVPQLIYFVQGEASSVGTVQWSSCMFCFMAVSVNKKDFRCPFANFVYLQVFIGLQD